MAWVADVNPELAQFLGQWGWALGIAWLAALVLWRRPPADIERAEALRDLKAAQLDWCRETIEVGLRLAPQDKALVLRLIRRAERVRDKLVAVLPAKERASVLSVIEEASGDVLSEVEEDYSLGKSGESDAV
jgi:hypothetical protein